MKPCKAKSVSKKQVERRIKGLSPEQQKAIVCALVGHSRIRTFCFGYHYCARCGETIGDSLGGVGPDEKGVYVGHDCKDCRQTAETLTWQDTFLAPDPSQKESSK